MDLIYAQKKVENGRTLLPQMYGDPRGYKFTGKPEWYHFTPRLHTDRLAEIWDADPAPDMPGAWRVADDAPPAPAAIMLDSDKARHLLGWRERKGLDEGVQEAVAWHKAAQRGDYIDALAALGFGFLEIGTIELHSLIAETTDMYVVPALQRD